MYNFLKRASPYILIIIFCLGAYSVSKRLGTQKLIKKDIVYVSNTASEVYMVWGINFLYEPPKKYWPPNSFVIDNLVYSKMANTGGKFTVAISLPNNTSLNYWMVQKRDKSGNETDIWDAGENDEKYFTVNFKDDLIYKPAYFIFLAGFLPLLLFYFKNRNNQIKSFVVENYKLKEYIPQLDSIRAIAVLLVIIHHWVSENSILNFFNNGRIGVNIFFVLSGFLITGILLKGKKQAEEQGLKRATVFRNFYIRRTLRIFPIYYLYLFFLWTLNDPAIKEDGVYYFTYTSNFLFYSQQYFPGRVAHLWSLGVEEQFYLVWPWLILFASKRILPYLIALFWVIGVSSNYVFTSVGWWAEILTPACFDAFAIGGFLSWIIAYRPDMILKLRSSYRAIVFAVLLIAILDVFNITFLPARTIHSFVAILLIFYCLFKNDNIAANYVLNNKWLIRIGKISYGIYLYHLFIPELWVLINQMFASWGMDFLFNSAVPEKIKPAWFFIQEFFLLLLIAALSWRVIEKPINKLKSRFENKSKPVLN